MSTVPHTARDYMPERIHLSLRRLLPEFPHLAGLNVRSVIHLLPDRDSRYGKRDGLRHILQELTLSEQMDQRRKKACADAWHALQADCNTRCVTFLSQAIRSGWSLEALAETLGLPAHRLQDWLSEAESLTED